MNVAPIKRVPTFFLKAVLLLIEVGVLALCAFSFLPIWQGMTRELPQYTYVIYPGLIAIYATFIPFSFALFQAWKLLTHIDKNNAFSELSIRALRNIKYSAVAMSILYAMGMPTVFVFADYDDAPGAVLIGAAFACAPLIVATFAAVLQKLVQSAVELKEEQDLTI